MGGAPRDRKSVCGRDFGKGGPHQPQGDGAVGVLWVGVCFGRVFAGKVPYISPKPDLFFGILSATFSFFRDSQCYFLRKKGSTETVALKFRSHRPGFGKKSKRRGGKKKAREVKAGMVTHITGDFRHVYMLFLPVKREKSDNGNTRKSI